MENQTAIRSFKDLQVYNDSYESCLKIMTVLLPRLPVREKFDLVDQLSRSSKAVPRLIAEGYAKRHQKAGFQKYLDDAMAESNETLVGLEQIKDIYNIEPDLCVELIDKYDKISRSLFKLAVAWDGFKLRSRQTTPIRAALTQND